MRHRISPPRCNVVEARVDGKLVDSTWHDCNNPNCPTSDAKK